MANIPPPETIRIKTPRTMCDGAGVIDAALGHPRVYLHVDDVTGFVDCGYCDRRFVLEGGPADQAPPRQPNAS
jgi:uncharacterized Zn-finger protein